MHIKIYLIFISTAKKLDLVTERTLQEQVRLLKLLSKSQSALLKVCLPYVVLPIYICVADGYFIYIGAFE